MMRKPSTPDSRLLHRRITGLNGEGEEVSRDDERDPSQISEAWIPARLSESADAIVCTLSAGFNAIPYLLFSSSLQGGTLYHVGIACHAVSNDGNPDIRMQSLSLFHTVQHAANRGRNVSFGGTEQSVGRSGFSVLDGLFGSTAGSCAGDSRGVEKQPWNKMIWRIGQQCLIVDIPRFCDMRGWRAPHDATAKTSITAISHTEMRRTELEPEQGAVSTANPSMAPVMQCRGAEPEG